MREQKGFSLIELLIVVAIILIIAAIAIPNLLRARIAANEASGVNSIRTINTSEITYASAYPTTGYSATIGALGPPNAAGCPAGGPVVANACLIDWVLSNATTVANSKSGYYFGYVPVATGGINTSYTVGGSAALFNETGVRGFCSNNDGVIHYISPWNAAPETTPATCLGWSALQ